MDAMTAAGVGLALAQEQTRVAGCYRIILQATLGRDLTPGTAETPQRAAKAWEELTSGYSTDVESLFKVFDGESYDEMIAATDIPFASLCEHHLLPFVGKAHIVYLANGEKIVGYSKMARVVEAFSRRLQNQERLTAQIADAIEAHLEPHGVLVVCKASHSCAALRGVKKDGMSMVTSVARGAMRDNTRPEIRAEAFALVNLR